MCRRETWPISVSPQRKRYRSLILPAGMAGNAGYGMQMGVGGMSMAQQHGMQPQMRMHAATGGMYPMNMGGMAAGTQMNMNMSMQHGSYNYMK